MTNRTLSRRRWPSAALLIVLLVFATALLVQVDLDWWAYVVWTVFATPMVATSLNVILRGEYYADASPPTQDL